MRTEPRGVTLVELLIVMAILLLLLTVTYGILSQCLAAYTRSDDVTPAFRRAAAGLDLMMQDLRQCARIYAPDQACLTAGYSPIADLYAPFVFVHMCPEEASNEVIGYRFDPESHTVQRLMYDPFYTPDDPATQVVQDRKSLIRAVDRFTVTHTIYLNDEFIQCGFTIVVPDRRHEGHVRADSGLRTKVKIRGGYSE